jgi:DHA1 family bicyclomycin/chloramphenicol resistance-like MFS transporter
MKFKVRFVSAVFNLRLLESQKTMKKPNQYRIYLPNAKKISRLQFEFVALMASLMSVVALAIDALLPALDIIGVTIGTTEVDNQLLITMIFLGLGFGPLVLAPFR